MNLEEPVERLVSQETPKVKVMDISQTTVKETSAVKEAKESDILEKDQEALVESGEIVEDKPQELNQKQEQTSMPEKTQVRVKRKYRKRSVGKMKQQRVSPEQSQAYVPQKQQKVESQPLILSKLTRLRRQKSEKQSSKSSSKKSSQSQMVAEIKESIQTKINPSERTRRRIKPIPTPINQDQDSEQEQFLIGEEPQQKKRFLNPKITFLIWKKISQEGQQKYLAKFQGRSHLHCQWLVKQQLKQYNLELSFSVTKSLQVRMRKTVNLKLQQTTYFNPNFTKPDRIIASAQEITAVNHKLLNQIRGHWSESMYLVCSKLLNFMKKNYPYGLHFVDPFDTDQEKIIGTAKPLTLTKVLNKILFLKYKSFSLIWKDLGRAINNFIMVFNNPDSDMFTIGQTMKEAAIFLYLQWHALAQQRYFRLVEERSEKIESMTEDVIGVEGNKVQVMFWCKSNILVLVNSVDPPQNQQQLKLLKPGSKTLSWLPISQLPSSQSNQPYQLQYLQMQDLNQLNLNTPINKIYLVKWKDLNYQEITWQQQSYISHKEKIQEFYTFNKYPTFQVQKQLLKQIKLHQSLLEMSQLNVEVKSDKYIRQEKQLYKLGMKQERKVYTSTNAPIYKNYRKLKGFQLQSLNWLINNWHQNRNCILADQMGLGKTIQTIAFIHHLYTHQKVAGPFLVLAPLTTLHQWRRQIEEWTNFNCLLYYDQGTFDMRQTIRGSQFFYLNISNDHELTPTKIPKFHILLTNYEIFMKDVDILKQIAFQHIILDEAHRLKNKNSKITTILNGLPCYRKLLLTGTPIQNNTKELWTLLNFIQPQIYASSQNFEGKYGVLQNEEQVKQFRRELKPYLLRRIKEDVETTIPKLSELIISVEMTNQQKKYYRGLLEKNKKEMVKGLKSANFNSISMQLRKCCNHPFLIAAQVENQLKKGCQNQQQEHQVFLKSSGKIILLLKLLQKFKKQGKKVLIFSQFVMLLDLVKPFLQHHLFNCQMLKGSLNSTLRNQAISRFNEDSNKTDVFLISTKAGGVGINLISASEVIIFDSDWNPQNDIQATARAHRIGQKKQVTVYRLITASSYQSEMFEISSRKLGLDKAIFTGQYFKSSNSLTPDDDKMMNKQEVEMLLKRGVLGFLQNQNNQEEYFNQSIEDILQKNAKKIEYNTTQSSFSKTTFKAQETGINIDAPDFWERALRNVETPLDKLVKKIGQLKDYDSVERQQELMIEAYQAAYVFVKQKTINSAFNAEDENSLNRFFRAIQNQRCFNKKYRQIAQDLIEEIEKPSRRFRVKLQDIYILNPGKEEQQEQSISQAEDKSSIKDEEKYVNPDEQKYEMKTQTKSQAIQQVMKVDEMKSADNFQKLCFICWRPKCKYFCPGLCNRAFHQQCLYTSQTGKRLSALGIEQRGWSFEQWQQKVSIEKECTQCEKEDYSFECSICMKRGTFDVLINSQKQKYKKFSNQLSGQMVFRCNMKNCPKFYHLKCLFNQQYIGKFADKAGKVIKQTKEQSILFRCPAHYCFSCYGQDYQLSKSRPICCAICSMTMHLKCAKGTQFTRLRKSTYICSKHNSFDRDLTEEFKLFGQKKGFKKNSLIPSQLNKLPLADRLQKLKDIKRSIGEDKQKRQKSNQIKIEKKQQQADKVSKEPKAMFKYGYRDFGVAPISQFDYQTYKGNWCRYCGSRFTQLFKKSPWGRFKLCYHHFLSWKKSKLDLSRWRKQPKQPIDKGRDTQIKYLNLMQQELKLRPVQTVLRLKQIMLQSHLPEQPKSTPVKQSQVV